MKRTEDFTSIAAKSNELEIGYNFNVDIHACFHVNFKRI